MTIKLVTNQKYIQFSFEYNMETDTPDGIVNEMKDEFEGLNDIKQ